MGIEIERKFLLRDSGWRAEVAESVSLRQGYLSVAPNRVVRIRLVGDSHGFITIKGVRVGDRRTEFEYEIPADDAAFMLDHQCLRPLIEKTRHRLALSPGEWTVDEFSGANAGLVLAEIEVPEGVSVRELPPWLGQEVTEDDRYANSYLQEHPYQSWD
jgi:adenylate cyclase